MLKTLKYRDERDKAYGLTGMVMALVLTDGENVMVEVSLDSPSGESMRFTPDFYFAGNPRYSAKLAWKQMLAHLNLTTGMLLGNTLCRSYLLDGMRLSDDMLDAMRQLVREQGADYCQLEPDEADHLLSRNYNYFDRVFSHRGVAAVAHRFADHLQTRRNMTLAEILDELSELNNL